MSVPANLNPWLCGNRLTGCEPLEQFFYTYLHLWYALGLRARLRSDSCEFGAPRTLSGCYIPNDLGALPNLLCPLLRPKLPKEPGSRHEFGCTDCELRHVQDRLQVSASFLLLTE